MQEWKEGSREGGKRWLVVLALGREIGNFVRIS